MQKKELKNWRIAARLSSRAKTSSPRPFLNPSLHSNPLIQNIELYWEYPELSPLSQIRAFKTFPRLFSH